MLAGSGLPQQPGACREGRAQEGMEEGHREGMEGRHRLLLSRFMGISSTTPQGKLMARSTEASNGASSTRAGAYSSPKSHSPTGVDKPASSGARFACQHFELSTRNLLQRAR